MEESLHDQDLHGNNHLDVGAGVIDSDYRGEVRVVIFNLSQDDYVVTPGERIAQMIIEKVVATELIEVDDLEETARSEGRYEFFNTTLNKLITQLLLYYEFK